MSKLTVEIVATREVSASDRQAIAGVFSQSFDHQHDAMSCLEPYFTNIQSLCLARDDGRIVGFQFYQEKMIAGCTVHHFSLAGRVQDRNLRGLQARFGSMLIRRAITKVLPWKAVYLAGVTNSAKSYGNMYAVGGKCFPDILAPEAENPFGEWYYRVAEQLGLASLETNGLLKNRMQGLGFAMREEIVGAHPLGQAYSEFVERDINHGIFTLIEIVPIRDIPKYLLKRSFPQLRQHPIFAAKTS